MGDGWMDEARRRRKIFPSREMLEEYFISSTDFTAAGAGI